MTRTVIAAAALIVALTAPAHAYVPLLTEALVFVFSSLPVTVTAPIIASIGITSAAQILTGALVIGATAASFFIKPQAPSVPTIDPGKLKDTFEGEDSPEINAIGRVRMGGVKFFGNTVTFDRYRLIGQCKGPIDLIEETYLGGQEVVIDPATGVVTSNPYTHTGTTYVWIWTKIGDGTETAWSQLTTAFPELWTAAHRVRGIAQTLAKYVSPGFTAPIFQLLYQGGEPPVQHVLRAQLIYDPRVETSAEWRDNGILCALHVLLTWPEFSLSDFDVDFIIEQADLADALVDTKTGTEKRSRCWGVWTSEMSRSDVMDQLLRSVGAEIVPRPNDKLGIALIDDERTAEVEIPLRHIVDLSWKSGPESVERPNLCRVKYYSPERDFEMTEIDLTGIDWARDQQEIDAFGEKPLDIDLPFCPSASQAQRIARRLFATARADVGVCLANMYGLAVWGTRCVDFEFPDELGTQTCVIGPPRVRDGEGQVEIPYVVWPDLPAWDPATDEADAPERLPNLANSDPLDTPNIPVGATIVTNGDGTFTRIQIFPVTNTRFIEACYREMRADGEPATAWLPMTEYSSIPGIEIGGALWVNGFVIAYVEESLAGATYEFRVRCRDVNDDRGSQWSPTLSVVPTVNNTAPAVPTIIAVDNGDGTATITVTTPESLHVAYVVTQGEASPGTEHAVNPGDEIEFEDDISASGTYVWTAQAFNSAGIGSGEVSSNAILVP